MNNLIPRLTRHTDIMLAALVVAVISLMILPLPPLLVDALIATNLAIAVSLLMISLYIPNALSLSTFPTLLLFTTLFRLALNVTTTRQILLHAHAGKIIDTFGNLVVGGNVVVGGVVFLIITIVQFLVVAKGAERVAEVGARFTLDAMPGKQMSIDADLRAGTIDMEEARTRRSRLEKESQLYGAMDGAMKFVKGDAIAGLIVTGVNILGGLAVGTLQKDMGAGEALQTFSVLTIGDGLISQIPALFISITAGVITTRVSVEQSKHLGGDIGGQVMAQPKALTLGGLVLLGFALIPGFPKLQFIGLGALVGGLGLALQRRAQKEEAAEENGERHFEEAPDAMDDDRDPFAVTIPLLVDVAADVKTSVAPKILDRELKRIRKALYLDLGVPFPGIHLRFNGQLTQGTYNIMIGEIPVAQGQLIANHLLLREDPENLEVLGIEVRQEKPFLPDMSALWVDATRRDDLLDLAVPFLEPAEVLAHHLSFLLKKHADQFIGLQETKELLDRLEGQFDVLVKEVQRVLPISKITEIFQRLVGEGISIRDLRTILGALIDWGQKEKDVVLLTEYVRTALKRYISYTSSGGMNVLAAYMLDTEVEEMLRGAVRQTSGGSYLALDPDSSRHLIGAVKEEVGIPNRTGNTPVLLVSMDIRRYTKKLIEREIPHLNVLSFQELSEDITVQPLGNIAC